MTIEQIIILGLVAFLIVALVVAFKALDRADRALHYIHKSGLIKSNDYGFEYIDVRDEHQKLELLYKSMDYKFVPRKEVQRKARIVKRKKENLKDDS